jgi:hypothetical protein
MQDSAKFKIPADYFIAGCICVLFVVIAFVMDTPLQIFYGYLKINASRSVLITDYIALAGLSAALVNSAIQGFLVLFLLVINKRYPDGKIIAAFFLTIGFSLFGKNMFNTVPIMLGVWLYAKFYNKKFSELMVQVMGSGTIGPLVSELAFLNENFSLPRIIIAYGVGLFVGFIFPKVVEAVKRMHRGHCLYNSGIAGGFIATFFVGLLRSAGIDILPERYWDTSHSSFLAFLAYSVSIALIIYGIARETPKKVFRRFMELLNERDENDNDFFAKYGSTCYINIGIMCIVTTSLMLSLGIPINGPVLGGILTVAGFAAAGKHLKNTIPILAGSLIAAHFNFLDRNYPLNSLAILFSTGLAPVCGKYGMLAGIIVGFFHVSVAIFIGDLNGGLNLYNNGFAGGFIAITIVPLISSFKRLFARAKTRKKLPPRAKP